jgi:Ser/Thr protein kinase RdoA (MazF antagonist)
LDPAFLPAKSALREFWMDDAARARTVLENYALSVRRLSPLAGGLINRTFLVDAEEGQFILQALHPIFKAPVHIDIEAVTRHVLKKGLTTPLLVRTPAGALCVEISGGEVWRVLTHVPARTHAKLTSAKLARSAGALVGLFHRATADLEHVFCFRRAGVHDTAAHLQVLQTALDAHIGHRLYDRIAPLGESILKAALALPPLDLELTRIAHGDLKVSNLLFDDADAGVCLVDLDTLGRMPLAHEMGDAWRSWCNPATEDEPAPAFDLGFFEASAEAYLATMGDSVSAEERDQLVTGTATITLELSARFCADALRESYFGWNPAKFPDRSTHNLIRAMGQFALYQSLSHVQAKAEAIVKSLGTPC